MIFGSLTTYQAHQPVTMSVDKKGVVANYAYADLATLMNQYSSYGSSIGIQCL